MNSIWKIMDCLKQKKSNLCYIDLFCGAGGTSTGISQTRINDEEVARVIACVNHDKNAIASHSENHPNALHFIEDIRTLNLEPIVKLVSEIRSMNPEVIIVLWASLECTNFSKAKGGLARDPDSRTLAEHLYRYIDEIQPDYIQIENVEEFMCWGDLNENGKPISKDKGRCYLSWIAEICKYGYHYDWRILNSADYGAYTSRKRFFGIFARHGLPISFPEPTHSKGGSSGLFAFKKWKAVKDVLDLSDEGESIFTRKKPLSDKTLERIYAGLIKFVAGGKEKWILKYNSMSRSGKHIPPDIDSPCPVVSCQNRLGLVSTSFLSKYYSGHPASKNISLDEPAHTIKCIDNHALVKADFLQAYYGNGDNVSSIDVPSPTVTTKDRLALVQSQFLDMQYGNSRCASLSKPAGAVTSNPKHCLITASKWIMNTNFNNIGSSLDDPSQTITANRKWHYLMNPQFASSGRSINNPCFTLIARMDKKPPYLIQTEEGSIRILVSEGDSQNMIKIKEFMAIYGIIDIKMRMLRIPELKQIMGFPKDYVLVGTQADQKKFIGNAVEVSIASALCKALYLANFSDAKSKIA